MTDALGLQDKPTLVVGGGSGIGRATALLLAQFGARLAVADLDRERAADVANEIGGHPIVGDVTDEAAAKSVVDEAHEVLGGLTGVANIIGLAEWGDVLSTDLRRWNAQFEINLLHHLLVAQAAARHMIREGGGALALVASVSAIYGARNHASYGAAKAGLNSLVRTMADEWGSHGIRINSVAPDVIATPRVMAAYQSAVGTDSDSLPPVDGVPMGRYGAPAEIAGPLVFLLSDLSSFMTGQCLVVDGGSMVRFPHGVGRHLSRAGD